MSVKVRRVSDLRFRILLHSHLYYQLDSPIISDSLFDELARELWKLTEEHPSEAKLADFGEEFKDWNGTGSFKLKVPEHVKEAAVSARRNYEELRLVLLNE